MARLLVEKRCLRTTTRHFWDSTQ